MAAPPFIKSIGVPKEIKPKEFRVGLIPQTAAEYVRIGTNVYIESQAGEGAGFNDEHYTAVGCQILNTAKDIYDVADMIIKVKEPLPEEYYLIRPGQILFTYFHFASSRELTEMMIKSKAVCIAYETVQSVDRSLPLLTPMSEIAGRMAVLEGAKYLQRQYGGSGVLLSGAPGVMAGKVLILGGGIVGTNAARIAAGMGAHVTIMDIDIHRLRQLDLELPPNCQTLYSNRENILKMLSEVDLVIGAVLVVGAASPILISKSDIELMKPGSVIIDVAVDQGGCIATCKPTTHDDPFYIVGNVVHYCVSNMPGAVPYTATTALNNATLKYGKMIASMGWKEACKKNVDLMKGVNVVEGVVTCEPVAKCFNLPVGNIVEML